MKNKLGYYVLSKKDTKALHAAIEKTFEFDIANSMTMHPMVTHPGYLHIDVLVGEKEDETLLVSTGASSKKALKYFPSIEVFAKIKNNTEQTRTLCKNLIDDACFNNPADRPPNAQCILLSEFEYLFLDGYDEYHDTTGYWGLFIVPKIETDIDGKGYEFYQIIPAYKEELEFIEENSTLELRYGKLCEAIINQIPERQYFDVKHDKLSKKQLNDILNQLKKQKSEDDYVVG